MKCNRCGEENSTVEIRTNCELCGPIPLCKECQEFHLIDLAFDAQKKEEWL